MGVWTECPRADDWHGIFFADITAVVGPDVVSSFAIGAVSRDRPLGNDPYRQASTQRDRQHGIAIWASRFPSGGGRCVAGGRQHLRGHDLGTVAAQHHRTTPVGRVVTGILDLDGALTPTELVQTKDSENG